ncbi:MAG: hypothetical protein ACRD18_12505 [Terriglobia bacterium]
MRKPDGWMMVDGDLLAGWWMVIGTTHDGTLQWHKSIQHNALACVV